MQSPQSYTRYLVALILALASLASLIVLPHYLEHRPMPSAKVAQANSPNPVSPGSQTNRPQSLWSTAEPSQPTKVQVKETYGKLPLSFEANHGQTDAQVKFLARGGGYSLFLTGNEAVLTLRKNDKPQAASRKPQAAVLRMKLVGANTLPQVVGLGELPGKVNYFLGNDPAKWRTSIPTYAKVEYQDVYPGVNLVYYGNQRQLEYDFVVAPGADPATITLGFEGANKIEVDAQGDLVLWIGGGQVRQHKPLIYQAVNGVRQEVSGGYVLKDKHQVGFQLGAYDLARPLVIDPVLIYSTYLGGAFDDKGRGIAVDNAGNAYVSGATNSSNFFPLPDMGIYPPYDNGCGTDGNCNGTKHDGFVMKLSPTGTLLYLTYLGGGEGDSADSIAVDIDDNIYVTGSTASSNFPTTANALQPTQGSADCFMTKLNPAAATPSAQLVYSKASPGRIRLDAFEQHHNYDQSTPGITLGTPAPTGTCPANLTAPNDPGQCTATLNPGTATATDNCSGVTVTGTRSDGQPLSAPYPVGVTTITWKATDAAGNMSSPCQQTITVNDTEKPVITCPGNIIAPNNSGQCSAVVSYANPAVSDNCPGVGTPTCTPASGSTFPKGTTTVTCTVRDAASNTNSCSFTVTVTDTQAPMITSCAPPQSASANVGCQAAAPNFTGGVAATDNCTTAGLLMVTQSPAAGTMVSVGTTTVILTVKDAANNTSTCTTTFTVTDNTPPAITVCPAPQSAFTDASCQATVPNFTGGITATDNCTASGSLMITQSPAAGTPVGPGMTSVTITVKDAANNAATCTTTFTVTDNTKPVISNCPSPITVYTGVGATSCSATASWTPPTASDNCGTPTLTSTHNPGGTFPVGTTTVTYTATDGAGNQATCSFPVIVVDNTKPVIATCAASQSVNANASCQAAAPNFTGGLAATDNCTAAGSLSITQSPAAGTLVGLGATTVTITVTDAAGNSNTCPTTFTVNNSPPVGVSAGGPYTVNEGNSVAVTAAGNDPEGGALSFAWDLDNDGIFETPGQSVTFSAAALDGPSNKQIKAKATDNCGLSTVSAAVTVNVLNVPPSVGAITAPIAPNPVNTVINASASFTDPGKLDTHTAVWNWSDGSASPGTITETNGSGSVSGSHIYTAAGVYIVTLTVTDDAGGAGQSVFQYVVIYDPQAGFVTGGGWIDSPAGAYLPNLTLTGKATFGFVSRYQQGATTPSGDTRFRFNVANLDFQSTSYEWLVVAGARAQFKGLGTINGTGNYGFMLTAIDGQINGGGGVDKFRIKIWNKNNNDALVYDNQKDAADGAAPTTALGGGSIVIHKP